jgi:hypothetical protein
MMFEPPSLAVGADSRILLPVARDDTADTPAVAAAMDSDHIVHPHHQAAVAVEDAGHSNIHHLHLETMTMMHRH